MPEPVLMPAMAGPQRQAWHALMDLYSRLPSHWTLIGGQLVHLHCAERRAAPSRPTNDCDTVVNVRAAPNMLETFTAALRDIGFKPQTSGDGIQHRWTHAEAQIDVLIPEGIGPRVAGRVGAGGAPTISAPGGTQALSRTEPVLVRVGGRDGVILRPNILGALVAKAAARTEVSEGASRSRHCEDFVILAGLVAARDFRGADLSPKDRIRLTRMVRCCWADESAMSVESASASLDRLIRAAQLEV